MKLDRIIWGILLLFIGGVLLLDNFGVIEFYWRNVWRFWPVFLIVIGVNMLFNRNNSQLGNILSIGILAITLTALFFIGQEQPSKRLWWEKRHFNWKSDDFEDVYEDTVVLGKSNFTQPLEVGDASRKTVLEISGGANVYKLNSETASLLDADVRETRKGMNFMLSKSVIDSVNHLNFKMKGNSKNIYFGENGNSVDFRLNSQPVWDMKVFMGAGQVDFDLSLFKVEKFEFDGGAADIDVKFGDKQAETHVKMKVGMADINIQVPKDSGCRVKTKTGFSSKDFDGFTKLEDGTYETPNYSTSKNKIYIDLDGGFSSFEIKRY